MQKRKQAPGAQDRGSLPRLALSATFRSRPAEQPSAGRNKWTSSKHVSIEDRGQGKCPHSKNSTISILFFKLSKIVCVNQAWWPVPVSLSLRRLRQARPCPGKTKESDIHRAALHLQVSCLSLTYTSLASCRSPLPLTHLMCLNMDFPVWALTRDSERMMVRSPCSPTSSCEPLSAAQPCRGAALPEQRRHHCPRSLTSHPRCSSSRGASAMCPLSSLGPNRLPVLASIALGFLLKLDFFSLGKLNPTASNQSEPAGPHCLMTGQGH